jgi:hypothetical protein
MNLLRFFQEINDIETIRDFIVLHRVWLTPLVPEPCAKRKTEENTARLIVMSHSGPLSA